MPSCNLCRLVSEGPPLGRVYEDDFVIVLVDTSRGPAQMLVVPKHHEESIEALGLAARHHLYKISERAERSLHAASGPPHALAFSVMPANDGHAHLRIQPDASA